MKVNWKQVCLVLKISQVSPSIFSSSFIVIPGKVFCFGLCTCYLSNYVGRSWADSLIKGPLGHTTYTHMHIHDTYITYIPHTPHILHTCMHTHAMYLIYTTHTHTHTHIYTLDTHITYVSHRDTSHNTHMSTHMTHISHIYHTQHTETPHTTHTHAYTWHTYHTHYCLYSHTRSLRSIFSFRYKALDIFISKHNFKGERFHGFQRT